MRPTSLALAVSAACLTVSAIHLAPRSENPLVVGLDTHRRSVSDPIAHDRNRLSKRQNVVQESLDNQLTLYYADISLGTPAQQLQVSIDTGSSDLCVNTATSSLCSSSQNPCEGGTYSQSSSSTSRTINRNFNISYVDGSGALGNYVGDKLQFGGVTLSDFQFGVAQTSTSTMGVLGIGYDVLEVQVNRAGGQPYPNLPLALRNAGRINTNAYSLWLNDLDSSQGSILFGGVDTAKYSGQLTTVPVLSQNIGNGQSLYYELAVALSGVSFGGKDVSGGSLPIAVVLDSGTSLTYLPDTIVNNIYKQVNVQVQQGTAYAYCEDANQGKNLSFTFSGKTINVPMDELYISVGQDQYGQPLRFPNGKEACIFGVASSQGSTPLLGDTFLRSAYVVYDLQNNQISLAQTHFNSSQSNIQEIVNGTTPVPGAVAASTTITSVKNAATGIVGRPGGVSGSNPNALPTNAAQALPAAFGAAAAGAMGLAALVF